MSPEIQWLESDGVFHSFGEQPTSPPSNPGVSTASFTATVTGDSVVCDGMSSSTTEGSITEWSWDFGDGTMDDTTGGEVTHAYAANGDYTIVLTVTNTDGVSNSTDVQVTIDLTPPPPPPNQVPRARFVSHIVGMSVTLDGSSSSDSDGSIVDYAFDFGDNAGPVPNYNVNVRLGGNGALKATGRASAALKAVIDSVSISDNVINVAGHGTGSSGSYTAYSWSWGDGLSSAKTSTATHTYGATGTFTLRFTVTDSWNDTASASQYVTITNIPQPPSSVGDSGVNQTGVQGRQQTGSGIVSINGVSGAAFNTAGAGHYASLPAGDFILSNFAERWGGSANGSQAICCTNITTGIRGILGAGSASTKIKWGTGTPPAWEAGATNNEHDILVQSSNGVIPDPYTVDGISIYGDLTSPNNYSGMVFYGASNFTMSNSTIGGIKGSGGSPETGETFMMNLQRIHGNCLMKNVTFDGSNMAAAGFGTNYQAAGATLTVQNMLVKNTKWSAAVAIHGTFNHGTQNWHNLVIRNCHRNFGCEANGGNVNIYDPLWDDFASGGHDFNITWTSGNYEGVISIYFTAQANWDAFIANRTNKKFVIIDNFQSYGDATGSGPYAGSKRIQDYFHVYIAGKLVGTGNSNYATGFAH